MPLSIIWFGVGEETKIFLLWLGTFFQLVLLVADDMRRVPHEYVEIAFTLGAKPRQVLTDVALRAMGPTLVDNLRITLGWCWTYLVIAEIVAADSGLGFVIWSARRFVKTPEVMAGVVIIGLIGLVTDQLLRAAASPHVQVSLRLAMACEPPISASRASPSSSARCRSCRRPLSHRAQFAASCFSGPRAAARPR